MYKISHQINCSKILINAKMKLCKRRKKHAESQIRTA